MASIRALHLSIRLQDLGTALRVLSVVQRQHPDGIVDSPEIHGDGWHAWAEPLGTELSYRSDLHVIVHGTPCALEDVVRRAWTLLAPDDDLCIAVESTVSDWSIDTTGGRVWRRIDADNNRPQLVVEYVEPWSD